MPDSEALALDAKPTPVAARRYAIAMALTMGIIIANALFNIIVNPVGEFGPPRRHLFNRITPVAATLFASASDPDRFHEGIVADATTNMFLIGTSRMARGIDSCDHPEITRINGFAWGMGETAHIVQRILADRPKPATLLIELATLNETPDRRDPVNNYERLLFSALSTDITRLSVETVALNMRQLNRPLAARAANCRMPDDLKPISPRAIEQAQILGMMETGQGAYNRGLSVLGDMIASADRRCVESGVTHTIIFFALPPTAYVSALPVVQRLLKTHADDVRRILKTRHVRKGGCRIRYLDATLTPPGTTAEQALWRERSEWANPTHFSPHLGKSALEMLLRVARPADAAAARGN